MVACAYSLPEMKPISCQLLTGIRYHRLLTFLQSSVNRWRLERDCSALHKVQELSGYFEVVDGVYWIRP